jgi:DNA polymerase I
MKVVNVVAHPQNGMMTVYEQIDGGVARRVVRGEYVCYLEKSTVTRWLLRGMRMSPEVLSITQEGDRWLRVVWRSRFDRERQCDPVRGGFARNGIVTYEADVPPMQRWMADHEEVQIAQPRRVYFDIETDARVPLSRKEEQRILCWSLIDDAGKSQSGVLEADTDDAERALLCELWQALDAYDQVLAWNGENFDFPILFARSKLYNIVIDARRWLWLDHLELFRRMNISASESGDEKQSMALQSIAMSVLKEGKLPGFDFRTIFPAWLAGGEQRAKLVEYNLRDVQLMQRIEAKTGYVALLQTLCEVTGVFPDTHGIQPMPQVEQYMLRLGRKYGVHFATRERHANDEEGFRGAFVMEPRARGIARDVHVVDFSSMYPSIILSWNMSPETVRDPVPEPLQPLYLRHLPLPERKRPEGHAEVPSNGMLFVNEPRGLLAVALEELLRMRKEWSEKAAHAAPGSSAWVDAMRRSTAYKIAANSFFGVVGAQVSRLYEKRVAESITSTARWLIEQTLNEAKSWGMTAVYGDTDSGFLQGASDARVREFVAHCNEELYPRLVAERGCIRNAIKLAYEKKFERILFVGAKRYIGRYEHYKGEPANEESKPEVKGLEYKRGDSMRLARRLQAEVIDLLMGGGVEIPACADESAYKTSRREECAENPEVFVALVERYRTLVLEGQLLVDDVKLSKRLARPVGDYVPREKKNGGFGDLPPHVRVAAMLAERGEGVGVGARIDYFVVNGAERVVAPVGDWTGEFDRIDAWEKHVWPPTARLLEAAFPALDWNGRFARIRPWRIRQSVVVVPSPSVSAALPKERDDTKQLGLFSLKAGGPRH